MQSHRRRAIFALVLVLNASVHLHDLRGFVPPGSLRTTRADSRCSDVVCGASFGRAAVAAALNACMALVENFSKLFEFSTGVQKMREALPTQSIEVKDEKSSEDVLSHHAQQLCTKIVCAVKNGENLGISGLSEHRQPAKVVDGVPFELLMTAVLAVNRSGCTAVHAEPGVGKSIASLRALPAGKVSKNYTVLLDGSFEDELTRFFRVTNFNLARRVARLFFVFLEKAGVSMNMVLDNCLEGDALSEEMKADWIALLKAAYQSGHHLVAVVQSETMAQSIANLNGARSRVAPEQLATTKYRWTKEQAQKYLALMLEERDIQPESINQEQFLINASIRDAHGGWLPVQMRNYLDNADEPRPPGAFTVKLCVMCQ